MGQSQDNPAGQPEGARVLRRIDKLVEAGRVTSEEAARVRAAANSDEVDDAVRQIRLRHARARFGAEVSEGRLTQDEADIILRRIENGEHRGLLGDRRRRMSSEAPAPPPARGGPDADAAAEEHRRGPHV